MISHTGRSNGRLIIKFFRSKFRQIRQKHLCTRRGDPLLNKFEQVPSLGHHMSGPSTGGIRGQGVLYGEVQFIMGNGHMGLPMDRQTYTIGNITFPKLRWWAVINEWLVFPGQQMRSRCEISRDTVWLQDCCTGIPPTVSLRSTV